MKNRKWKNRMGVSRLLVWLILIAALFVFSIPFLFMISNSFETFSYVLPYPPRILPSSFNLDAYKYVLSMDLFVTALKNSVINTCITVVVAVFISSLSAYGFAKIDFPGREAIFNLYLFTLMMPSFLNIIPQFLVLKEMNMIGTRSGLILVYVATNVCGHTFFLRNYFKNL